MTTVKIFPYEKFWDSFLPLPKNIQKKVVDFQNKFRTDSTSAAIHLEPIKTFKDPTLRSARIDQTYRAILKSFNNGNIYYLMWVDHHDKAYQWAENKVFEWNENTQAMQVFSNPEVIAPPIFNNNEYEGQEGIFEKFRDEDLIKLGLPEILLTSIKKVKNLDDLGNLQRFLPEDIFDNLYYLAEGANIANLLLEIEEGKVKDEALDKQVESLNNQRSFIELTDDQMFNDVLTGNLDKWKYYLHPSQRKLVNSDFSGSVKVTGGAGTGKTVAALHRLKYLVNQNPGAKILFTTYTKALTGNLTEAAKGLNVQLSNVKINNIDAVAFDLGQQFNLISKESKILDFNSAESSEDLWNNLIENNLISYDVSFLEAEFTDVILNNNVSTLREYVRTPRAGRGKPILRRQRQELWEIFEMFKDLRKRKNFYYKAELYNKLSNYLTEMKITPFDYCIVDELQDFSNVELRLIRSFVGEKQNDLFMVGDPLQKIYERKLNFSKAGINIRGKKSQRLRVNYRTTEEIKRLAISIIQDCHYDNFEGEEEEKTGYVSLRRGEKPEYMVFKSKDQEVRHVVEKVQQMVEQGFAYSDLVISSRSRNRGNGYKDFKTALHNANLPYYEYESGKIIGEKNGIPLLTFHNIKGLEFKHVFLVDVNDRSCPKLPYDFESYEELEKESYYRNERSLLYVAISRAVHNVVLSGTGRKSEMINL